MASSGSFDDALARTMTLGQAETQLPICRHHVAVAGAYLSWAQNAVAMLGNETMSPDALALAEKVFDEALGNFMMVTAVISHLKRSSGAS